MKALTPIGPDIPDRTPGPTGYLRLAATGVNASTEKAAQ
jgi:hypothetical protein